MFKAVKFGKIRVRDGLAELRGANVFKLNEDFLTAAVLARLLYLPSDVTSSLLLLDYGAKLGKFEESTFWPTWSVRLKDGKTVRVEPDVYLEFENFDLIVEAKLDDDPGCQTPGQWAREWAAWHQGNYTGPGKQPLLIGIGGLGPTNKTARATATEIVEAANRILTADFPGVPAIRATGLSWQGLYDRLTSGSLDDGLSSHLLEDLREILGYFGLRRYHYLGDLAETLRQSMIDTISFDSFQVVMRWRAVRRAPNWVEASKSLRPILSSSIDILRSKAWKTTN